VAVTPAPTAVGPFTWRPATPADVPALAALYRAAALCFGPEVYTGAQVAAWAGFPDDAPAFRRYVLDTDTWLAEHPGDAAPLGFCGVDRAGAVREVHSLYVRPQATRQGLGSAMLRRSLQRAQGGGACRFGAWVTPFSRPVFLRAGFTWTRTVAAEFAGTVFERYRVERG
jgi:putative acetyltransferase